MCCDVTTERESTKWRHTVAIMILPETKQRAYTRFSSLIKQDTLRADNKNTMHTDIYESYMTRDISCCGGVTWHRETHSTLELSGTVARGKTPTSNVLFFATILPNNYVTSELGVNCQWRTKLKRICFRCHCLTVTIWTDFEPLISRLWNARTE